MKKCGNKSLIVTIMSVDQIHDGKVWRSILCVRFNHYDKNCCYILGSFIWYVHKFYDTNISYPPETHSRRGVVLWRHGVVVFTTAQLHSTKPELRFFAAANTARCVSEIRDGEDF